MPALVIEVRFLDDRYHGVPEWPPSPGRLFQALVAGASSSGKRAPAEDAALQWLERQSPPSILAPRAEEMRGFTSYVPNNDGDQEKDPASPSRIGKSVRAILLPESASLRYLWPNVDAVPEGLLALCDGLYQLGRGVDPAYARAFTIEEHEGSVGADQVAHVPAGAGSGGVDCPLPGTLDTLDARHVAFLGRLRVDGVGRKARTSFANPPKARFARVRYDVPARVQLFELRDANGGFRSHPASSAGQIVAAWLSDIVTRLGPDLAVEAERFVLGRDAGSKDKSRRVRAFALPTVRMAGDRDIRRLCVEIPPDCPVRADDLLWACGGSEAFRIRWGQPVVADDRRMLNSFTRLSRLWQSETAVKLPVRRRRLSVGETKAGQERAREEAAASAAVITALRHAGIPQTPRHVRVQREPFSGQGSRAESFATGTRFSGHEMWHVELHFAEKVAGPVVIGDGRFAGLGLMHPVDAGVLDAVIAFRIIGGLARQSPDILAASLRRAALALYPDPVPTYVSGHAEPNKPSRDPDHRHVAFVADLPRQRLLIVPPKLIAHDDAHKRKQDEKERVRRMRERAEATASRNLQAALAGLSTLRAGPAGALRLRPDVVCHDDPVFTTATVWESVTPYNPTRHPKSSRGETLQDDVRTELKRRGLPDAHVKVIDRGEGPSRGVTAHIRLTFPAAVKGPILLGRTLHKGGGLFAASDPTTS